MPYLISRAKVYPCALRRSKVKPDGFLKKSPRRSGSIFYKKPCTACTLPFYAPETKPAHSDLWTHQKKVR